MENPVKEYNTDLDMLKDGSILKVYGSKTFLNVAPVYNIDKVRFSVVDIGRAGKNAVDIYLTCEEVRRFVKDIDTGVAAKKIAADTGNYPTAYSWTKGVGGSKRLVIGGGQKGVRVQASVNTDNDKQNKYAVIQFADLDKLSFMFKLTAGLVPVQDGSYYHSLYKAFKDTENKYTSSYNEAADASYTEPVVEDEAPMSAAPVATPALEQFSIVTRGSKVSRGNYNDMVNACAIPITFEGSAPNSYLILSAEQVDSLSWFKAFKDRVESGADVKMTLLAVRDGNNLIFKDVKK